MRLQIYASDRRATEIGYGNKITSGLFRDAVHMLRRDFFAFTMSYVVTEQA